MPIATTSTMRHYTDKADFTLDRSRKYEQGDVRMKPNGLWLSIDDNGNGWADWCRAEDFQQDRLSHSFEFSLRPDAKVLHLTADADYRELNKAVTIWKPSRISPDVSFHATDWSCLVPEYQGVIFDNYQPMNTDRFQSFATPLWYSVLDCESACIWDLSAIA